MFPPLFRVLIFVLPFALQEAVAPVEPDDVVKLATAHWRRLLLGFAHLDTGGRQLIVVARPQLYD